MSKIRLTRFSGILAIAVAVPLFVVRPALAQHVAATQDKASKSHADDEGVATVTGGHTAAADPATGKLRPITPQEARALTAAMAKMVDQSSEGLTAVYHPDGMVSIDLEERFQSVSMARVATSGSVATGCATSAEEARQFFGVDTAAPGPGTIGTPEEK